MAAQEKRNGTNYKLTVLGDGGCGMRFPQLFFFPSYVRFFDYVICYV